GGESGGGGGVVEDAGADHGSEEKSGAEKFRSKPLCWCRRSHRSYAFSRGDPALLRPMSSSRLWRESSSSERRGRLVKILIRWLSMRYVSPNTKARSASFPVACDGSGTPQ